MPNDEQLDSIRQAWDEENRYRMISFPPYKIFERAQKDTSYLLNRLEAAEKTAKGLAVMLERHKASVAEG